MFTEMIHKNQRDLSRFLVLYKRQKSLISYDCISWNIHI